MGKKILRFNLYNLRKALEVRKQRDYETKEIAAKSGLHRNTIDRLTNNATTQVHLETLAALLAFFEDEGMPIEMGQLFVAADAPTDATQ